MLPEWMHYDRHLNALMIEPSLCNNKADFEDHYVISILGNDQRIRAQFLLLFEHREQSEHTKHSEQSDNSEHRVPISPAVLSPISPTISPLDRDESEEEYIGSIVYTTTTALPNLVSSRSLNVR